MRSCFLDHVSDCNQSIHVDPRVDWCSGWGRMAAAMYGSRGEIRRLCRRFSTWNMRRALNLFEKIFAAIGSSGRVVMFRNEAVSASKRFRSAGFRRQLRCGLWGRSTVKAENQGMSRKDAPRLCDADTRNIKDFEGRKRNR